MRRREELMRQARQWVFSEFFPNSLDDIRAVLGNPQHSAYFRQATSYWDMAAAMVNHGCVNAELFYDTNGEYLAVWAKIGDLVPELRQGIFGPQYMKNLERLVANQPGAMDRHGSDNASNKWPKRVRPEPIDHLTGRRANTAQPHIQEV